MAMQMPTTKLVVSGSQNTGPLTGYSSSESNSAVLDSVMVS